MFMIQHCILIIAYRHHKNMYWFTFKKKYYRSVPKSYRYLKIGREPVYQTTNQPTSEVKI